MLSLCSCCVLRVFLSVRLVTMRMFYKLTVTLDISTAGGWNYKTISGGKRTKTVTSNTLTVDFK